MRLLLLPRFSLISPAGGDWPLAFPPVPRKLSLPLAIAVTTDIMSTLTVHLDANTLGALDRLVEKTDRSREWLVAKAVEDYVALNAWHISKIEEGIAAADRGDFASDEELVRLREKFAPNS
jgi:predicted transcriptional regulator